MDVRLVNYALRAMCQRDGGVGGGGGGGGGDNKLEVMQV